MMKRFIIFSLGIAGVVLLSAGCATRPRVVVNQAIGPAHGSAALGQSHGQLVVYTGWESSQVADTDFAVRTPYEIFGSDGGLVRSVHNDAGGFERKPVTVRLPVGEYGLASFVPGLGRTILPVRIEPGLTTTVYLDGSGNRLRKQTSADLIVQLPNGDVAGWSANLATTAAKNPLGAE